MKHYNVNEVAVTILACHRGHLYEAVVHEPEPGQVSVVDIFKDGKKFTTGYWHNGVLDWEDYWGNLAWYQPAFEKLEEKLRGRENLP